MAASLANPLAPNSPEEYGRGWIMLELHHLAGDPVAYLRRACEHASRRLLPAPSR